MDLFLAGGGTVDAIADSPFAEAKRFRKKLH
jgi:hypothetical protein